MKLNFANVVTVLVDSILWILKNSPLLVLLRSDSDCVAATSLAAQDATLEHNFGMFSIQTNSEEVAKAIEAAAPVVTN